MDLIYTDKNGIDVDMLPTYKFRYGLRPGRKVTSKLFSQSKIIAVNQNVEFIWEILMMEKINGRK